LYKYADDMAGLADGLAQDAQEKGDIGGLLKYTSESVLWKTEAKQIKKDLIELCWDEEDGMFRDYAYQGESVGLQKDCDALSAVVAPLWAGMLDPNDPKEARMLERSLDNISTRFEKAHGLAATAEDYGHPEMQWNAPSGWAPLMMMAVSAEKRYGRSEDAARHTEKWLDNLAGL
jgi:alpha,alpha-trehalase